MNPIVPGIGMSDPHARVFGDTLYLYGGHDAHPDDKTWVMRDWRIHATRDLVGWEQVGVISPADTYIGAGSTDCWAGDAIERDGRFFFYFSDRTRGIGVMTADAPQGPFRDALGRPLVAPMHDPTVFIDDDPARTPWLLYGEKSKGYHLARLNPDMVSLAAPPRRVEIRGREWEAAPPWMDKNYLFKHGGRYFLSWGRDYAVSGRIEGPYACVGAVGRGHHLDEYAHGSFFWWRGQFYHVWCHYLRPGFKYRQTLISYCHLDGDRVVTDTAFLDAHGAYGIGHYDARWPRIRAAWYYACTPGARKLAAAGDTFDVAVPGNGWLCFAATDFGAGVGAFRAELAGAPAGAALELRLDRPDGPLLGSARLADGGPQTVALAPAPVNGRRDLYLVARAAPPEPLILRGFSFAD